MTDQELDQIFETALAVGEETMAATETSGENPSPHEAVELEAKVENAVAVLDAAAEALPMEKSLQLLEIRETLAGTSDDAVDPLHAARGLAFAGLWAITVWLVIIAVVLWGLVLVGVHF